MKDENATRSEKIAIFFKQNIMTGILVLICVAYIIRGMFTIDKSGQTIDEIIAGGVLSFIVSVSIKTLLRKKGLDNGFNSVEFKATQTAYGKQIEQITPYISDLDTFCNVENESRLRQKQIRYLTKNAISQDLLNDEKYNIRPSRKDENYKRELQKYKVIKKARKQEVFLYTSKLLTNAYDSSSSEEKLLMSSTKTYQSSHTLTNIIVGIGCAILFGYYSLGKNGIDWWGMVWAFLQIALYLVFGFIEYLNAFEYVSKTIREKIKRIMVIIDKFNIWYKSSKNTTIIKELPQEVVTGKEEQVNEC